MGTIDKQFQATGPGQFGFFAAPKTGDGQPIFPWGVVSYGWSTGVLAFAGSGPRPEGPIQQNSYSLQAGVEGGSVEFTG